MTRILAETGVDPSTIELEITESVVMQDADRAIEILQSLRELGLKFAIDDFGTGYSSLAYLKRFPIDKLKIDQSFVRHLSPQSADAAIVQAIITLGHSLSLDVIAEGVESEEQREVISPSVKPSCGSGAPTRFRAISTAAPQMPRRRHDLSLMLPRSSQRGRVWHVLI